MANQVRAAALRFLKIRPRSVDELRQKLKLKKFEVAEIEVELKYLESIHMLNDRAFTESFIAYRLARPFGFSRIRRELREKGISAGLIDECIANAQAGFDAVQTVDELIERRLKRMPLLDRDKRNKRLADYLIRRGFPIDVVLKAIKKVPYDVNK